MADATIPTCIYPTNEVYDKILSNAYQYCININNEYERNKYTIPLKLYPTSNSIVYEYKILSDKQDLVCTIQLSIALENYKHYYTRSDTAPSCYGIYISSLDTEKPYLRQGHATRLLLYAVCDVCLLNKYQKLSFVRLEDATVGNQRRMKGHIYHKIGFTPTGLIELNINQKDYMKGIDSERIVSMEYLLTVIIPNYMMKGGSSKQKTRKSKTKKNKRAL